MNTSTEAAMFKSACRLHTDLAVNRYLMSCAHGRWDGAEKALRHRELCAFYVAALHDLETPEAVFVDHQHEYEAVHTATQALTDHLDEVIGFPLESQPDYDKLAPAFFERFHALAVSALAPSPQQVVDPVGAAPVAYCSLTDNGQIAYFDGKPMVMPGPVGNECHPTPLYAGHPPLPMVDMTPPATARDRWMYRQGWLAALDPRSNDLATQATTKAESPTLYVEVRECNSCGHVGINDDDGKNAACNTCYWVGPSPEEDRCPGCNAEGVMTSACAKCGERSHLLASAELPQAARDAQTPPSVPEHERYVTADELLQAAHAFWKSESKAGQPGAVKWLTADDGSLLIFTRGEYREALMRGIHDVGCAEHFYDKDAPADSQGKEAGS